MNEILVDLSTPALAAGIKNNLFKYYRYLGRSPYAELYQSPYLTWLLTGINHPFLNNVIETHLTSDNVDASIEETLVHFKSKHMTQFSWWVEPGSHPSDLAEHLLAHGLAYTDGSPGMAVDLLTLQEEVAIPAGLVIEPVADVGTLKKWVDAFVSGFGIADSEHAAFDLYTGLGFKLPLRNYLGYLHGEPVATAQLFLGAGVAGIYCVSTAAEARRQGISTYMVWAALRDARIQGYRAGILQSTKMGYTVYLRLGFQELCKLSHFYSSD